MVGENDGIPLMLVGRFEGTDDPRGGSVGTITGKLVTGERNVGVATGSIIGVAIGIVTGTREIGDIVGWCTAVGV